MFLSVPATMCGMEKLNDHQRSDLAARLADVVIDRYGNNKKAAYTAADVNSATFDNALAGRSLSARTLTAIVRTFWPDTRGDWQRLDPPLAGTAPGAPDAPTPDAGLLDQIEGSDLSEGAKAALREMLLKEAALAESEASPRRRRRAT